MNVHDEIAIEIARTFRECAQRIEAKVSAKQHGEAFDAVNTEPVAGEFYWVKMPRWADPVIAECTGSKGVWRVAGSAYLESGAFICAHIPRPEVL